MTRGSLTVLAIALLCEGCTLSSGVDITPLDARVVSANVDLSLEEFSANGQYLEVIRAAQLRPPASAAQSLIVGRSQIAAGRFEAARRILVDAIPSALTAEERGDIEWELASSAYLQNDFATALVWALEAKRDTVRVVDWYVELLRALSSRRVYEIVSTGDVAARLESEKPQIPRVSAVINGVASTAVIDSGATLSIVSRSFATRAQIESLGDFTGLFYGLLGEPITVSFGIVKSVRIGSLEVRNVPVAIMPDDKLAFVTTHREPFAMDVLLGAHFLKEFVIDLDFRLRRARFRPITGSRRPADDQNLFFLELRPGVRASLNRKEWRPFILDTGSEITFLNSEQLATTSVRSAPRVHSSTLQGLGGAQRVGAKVENVEIGVDRYAARFRDIPLYSAPRSRAIGIIGENLLRNFRVTIDFGAMRLELRR